MKRLDMIFVKIFLYGLPVVAALGVVFGGLFPEADKAGGVLHALNAVFGLIFALWIGLAIYLCIRLMTSASFRDRILSRITFMRERDEREVFLSGRAVKTVFLTSLSILIFLLCLSCFQLSVYRLPEEKAQNGKTGVVTMGLSFKLLSQGDEQPAAGTGDRRVIFSYKSLPLTSTGVIILLLIWQIACYNFTMRRLSR